MLSNSYTCSVGATQGSSKPGGLHQCKLPCLLMHQSAAEGPWRYLLEVENKELFPVRQSKQTSVYTQDLLMHSPDKQVADLPQLLTRHRYSSCSWALIHSSRSSQRCRSLRLYFMVNLPSFLCDDSSPGFSGVWKVTRGSALELLAMLTTSFSDSRNSPSSGLPHTFSLSPLIKASLQPVSPSTS